MSSFSHSEPVKTSNEIPVFHNLHYEQERARWFSKINVKAKFSKNNHDGVGSKVR